MESDAAVFRAIELHVARLVEACAKDEAWHVTHHHNLGLIVAAINAIAAPIDRSLCVVLQEPKGAKPIHPPGKTLHQLVEASADVLNDTALHIALRGVHDTQQFNELQEASFEAVLPLLKHWLGTTTADSSVGFTLLYEGARAFPEVFRRKANRKALREIHAALLNLAEDDALSAGLAVDNVVGLSNHIRDMCAL